MANVRAANCLHRTNKTLAVQTAWKDHYIKPIRMAQKINVRTASFAQAREHHLELRRKVIIKLKQIMEYVHQLCCERFITPYCVSIMKLLLATCWNPGWMDIGAIRTEHVSPPIWTGFFRSLAQVVSPGIVPGDCSPELLTTDTWVVWIALFGCDLFVGHWIILPSCDRDLNTNNKLCGSGGACLTVDGC